MIVAYTGKPGSGKSAHAARTIRRCLNARKPRPVLANFPLAKDAPVKHPELYTYMPNELITPERIARKVAEYYARENGGHVIEDHYTIILDECAIIFNSRLWTQKDRINWVEYMTQSRKHGTKVILIAQSLPMIDNQIRMCVELEHEHRRIKTHGVMGWLVDLCVGGNFAIDVQYLVQGNKRERVESEFFRPSAKDFAMYDSYGIFAKI